MKTIRWISFIPAFLIYVTIVNALAQLVCLWLYNFTFPANGILGYIGAGFSLMIMLGLYMYFLYFEYIILKICPKIFIGSRILLIIYSLPVIYFYMTNFDRATKMNLVFEIGIVLTLIIFCFRNETLQNEVKKESSTETQPSSESRSMVAYFKEQGIPSEDTTEQHLGQTSIMFVSSQKPKNDEIIEDEINTSIRYLNQRKGSKKNTITQEELKAEQFLETEPAFQNITPAERSELMKKDLTSLRHISGLMGSHNMSLQRAMELEAEDWNSL